MISTITPKRSSSETTCSDFSIYSDRSRRCASPTLFPPSIAFGTSSKPNIELSKPVWELNAAYQSVVVQGEVEVDISMFRRGDYMLPFSIGIHFTTEGSSSADESDSEDFDEFRGEWNQDGPGNYYRKRSFIKIEPRLYVDDVCYVKFSIHVPSSILPSFKESRLFNVSVKAYELGDPFNATEPSVARFMVLNRLTPSQSHDVIRNKFVRASLDILNAGKPLAKLRQKRTRFSTDF